METDEPSLLLVKRGASKYLLLSLGLQAFSPAHGGQGQPSLLGGDGRQSIQDAATAPLVLLLLETHRKKTVT